MKNITPEALFRKIDALAHAHKEGLFDDLQDWRAELVLTLMTILEKSLNDMVEWPRRVDYQIQCNWLALQNLMKATPLYYLVTRGRTIIPADIKATIDSMIHQFRESMETWANINLHNLAFNPFIINRRRISEFDTQDWDEAVLFDRWLNRYCDKLEKRLILSLKQGIWDGTIEGIKYSGELHPIQPPKLVDMYEFDRA